MIDPRMGGLDKRDWIRRAQPVLGTIVEVAVDARRRERDSFHLHALAFSEIARLQRVLSRFDPGSDVARFNGLQAGFHFEMRPDMAAVMHFAQGLREATEELFDISVGSAPRGWQCDDRRLSKLDDACTIDLGGIAKGYVVDRVVAMLQTRGCRHGWVNAGGDLRAFGDADVPVLLRDEVNGGAMPFARIGDGAFATSRFVDDPVGPRRPPWAAPHVSVAAPSCLAADALTKVIAATADPDHPLLARHGAIGFIHAPDSPRAHAAPVRARLSAQASPSG